MEPSGTLAVSCAQPFGRKGLRCHHPVFVLALDAIVVRPRHHSEHHETHLSPSELIRRMVAGALLSPTERSRILEALHA